jgi:hypothetical protein
MKPPSMSRCATYADLLRRIDELENDAIRIAETATAAGREHDEGATVVTEPSARTICAKIAS